MPISILPFLSSEAVEKLQLRRDGYVTVALEGDPEYVRIDAGWRATTYPHCTSYSHVLSAEHATLIAAIESEANDQIGGTFERWTVERPVIPLTSSRGRRWQAAAEQHASRALVWVSLLVDLPQYSRTLWSRHTDELIAARAQRDVCQRPITTLKRFEVSNSDGDRVATFYN
jgi:hypothetical protein